MNYTEYSTDGGITWGTIQEPVRFIFREVDEDNGGYHVQDLHITVTHEGLIYDLVEQVSGVVVATLATDIPEELT